MQNGRSIDIDIKTSSGPFVYCRFLHHIVKQTCLEHSGHIYLLLLYISTTAGTQVRMWLDHKSGATGNGFCTCKLQDHLEDQHMSPSTVWVEPWKACMSKLTVAANAHARGCGGVYSIELITIVDRSFTALSRAHAMRLTNSL